MGPVSCGPPPPPSPGISKARDPWQLRSLFHKCKHYTDLSDNCLRQRVNQDVQNTSCQARTLKDIICVLKFRGEYNSLYISVYGSSCNFLFFGLIFSLFLSLPTVLLSIPSCLGMTKRWQISGYETKPGICSYMNCRAKKL